MTKVPPDEQVRLDAAPYLGCAAAAIVGVIVFYSIPWGPVWAAVIAIFAGLITVFPAIVVCWAVADTIELNAALRRTIRPNPKDRYTIQLTPEMTKKEYMNVIDWACPVKGVPKDYVTLLDVDGKPWPSDGVILWHNPDGSRAKIPRPSSLAVREDLLALRYAGCEITYSWTDNWKIKTPNGFTHHVKDEAGLRRLLEGCRQNKDKAAS